MVLPKPVLLQHFWPALPYREKRAITLDELRLLVARELNVEWLAFYDLAWQTTGLSGSGRLVTVSKDTVSLKWYGLVNHADCARE